MRSIFTYWSIDWMTALILLLLIVTYIYVAGVKLKKNIVCFLSAFFLLILCTASPLHFIGMNYLFCIHMVTHILVLLIIAPLIVISIPANNKFKKILMLFSAKLKNLPLIGWLSGVSIMWIWHVPKIFNYMHSMHIMNGMMVIHLLSLLIAGMLFCWPIANPYQQYRIAPLTGVLYLSTACVFCSILGLLITFAPVGLYTDYIDAMDMYGYLPMIRNQWHISAAMDQQAAGLIMWVPCCFIYLSAAMYLLIKWLDQKNIQTVIQPINNLS